MRAKSLAGGVCALLILVCASGCQYEGIRQAQITHRLARPEIARESLGAIAKNGFSDRHAILGWLELGSAAHETGNFQASFEAFLRAESGFDYQDARPRTSISEEAFAALTNPLSVAYRGAPTDRVMAPTFRAINAMLMGDADAARSALNESAIRQSMNLERRSAKIEKARATAAGEQAGIDLDRSMRGIQNDPGFTRRFGSLSAYEPYRGFVNPFVEMLHAVFRLSFRRDAGDIDRGFALLRSVAGTVENSYVRAALESAADDEASSPPITHVFFATGFCPIREEFRLDLPLFLVNDSVDYVGVSFPMLVFDDDAIRALDVETPDGIYRTEMLADMDRLMGAEFREALPEMLTRAIIGTAIKAGASYGINEATRGDGDGYNAANAIARIVAGLYFFSQNMADTRSWATLPKWYQYARVESPQGGEILLSTPDGQSVFVPVDPESDTIVFVRSLRPGVGLTVRTVSFGASVIEPTEGSP